MTVLKTTARKLSTHNSERRLSIVQVAASLSDVASVAVERKISGSLQDKVKVDREKVKALKVKKQNLSVPNGNKSVVFAAPQIPRPVACVR